MVDSKKIKIFIALGFYCSAFHNLSAQVSNTSQLSGGINTITTAVPLLLITPDSRAGAMADCGVASSPDANSIHWNAAKLAFSDKKVGLSVSYTPWLRQLVNDINLAYLSGFYKIDKNSAIAGSLRYFSLGSITFT
ncbi:MAG: PorV/PorQ family protein, partial [Bacteroidota bacterium]